MKSLTFNNSCHIPDFLPDHKKTFRENSDLFFQEALVVIPLLKEKDLTLTYFQAGVGSIVAKIETDSQEKYVIKTSETSNQILNEIHTYKIMKRSGMKVPNVYFAKIDNLYPFYLMEYFEEETLLDQLHNRTKSPKEVGVIKSESLCKTNTIQGKGYGWSMGLENGFPFGNFENLETFFEEWLKKREYLEILSERYPKVDWEEEIDYHINITRRSNHNTKSCLGIFDLQEAHFFMTEPPTLFDGNIRLEPEYFDMAMILLPSKLGEQESEVLESLITQYREKNAHINIQALTSAIWLQAYRKSANLLKNPNEVRTSRAEYVLNIISDKEKLNMYIKNWF